MPDYWTNGAMSSSCPCLFRNQHFLHTFLKLVMYVHSCVCVCVSPRLSKVNTVVCLAARWRLEALLSGTWSLPKQTQTAHWTHAGLRARTWTCVLQLSATVIGPKQTNLMRSSSWDGKRESESETWERWERPGQGKHTDPAVSQRALKGPTVRHVPLDQPRTNSSLFTREVRMR